MAKVILVFDKPEECLYCPCISYGSNGAFCNVLHALLERNFDNHVYIKPDKCPLKNIPEKRNYNYTLNEAIENDCFDETDEDMAYFDGIDKGWNNCIDEILKGCE